MSENIVGVLFCGGKGTRMRPLTYYIQKVMMPIGNDQRPLLEYILRHFKKHGIVDIILLVNYKKEQIKGYFKDGESFGLNIEYVVDKPGYEGTGSALLNAKDIIKDRKMLIYYTDIISNINLTEMMNYHEKHNKWATLFLSRGWKLRVGTAKVDDNNNITEFIEKPTLDIFVNTGISILEPVVFEYLEQFHNRKGVDLSKDIFPVFAEKKQMVAYMSDCYWEDIGSIERYEKLDHTKISKLMELD